MGFLRILLAILVLAGHSQVIQYVGVLAVECFYLISGFYMAMILNENYGASKKGIISFYQSRALRIYVPYYIILCFTLTLKWLSGHESGEFSIYSFLANLFIIGQEHVKLFRFTYGCSYPLWDSMIIPPAWSVGMELLFYIVAPFILLNVKRTVIITAVLLLIKILFLFLVADYITQDHNRFLVENHNTLHYKYLCTDAFLNGVFPLELGVFSLGGLCYFFYNKKLSNIQTKYQYNYIIAVFSLIFITIFLLKDFQSAFYFKYYAYLCAIILLTPYLFLISSKNKYDRIIGNLSYPFYLFHFIILEITREIFGLSNNHNQTFIIALLVTLCLSAIFYFFIERKLDLYRSKYRIKNK